MGVFVALLFDYKFGNCQISKRQEQSVKKRLSVFSDSLLPPQASEFSTLPHSRIRGFPTRGHSTSARRGLVCRQAGCLGNKTLQNASAISDLPKTSRVGANIVICF